jgi:hypothetical protein
VVQVVAVHNSLVMVLVVVAQVGKVIQGVMVLKLAQQVVVVVKMEAVLVLGLVSVVTAVLV